MRGLALIAFLTLAFMPLIGHAEESFDRPPELHELQTVRSENKPNDGVKDAPPLDVRQEALKEAALSFGARGGLAMRTYEIRQELSQSENYLDKTFNFGQLLIRGPSGLNMEPPIITEAEDALIIEGNGQQAAVSDIILNINKEARIVTAPRNWRTYLEREWGEVVPPPEILLPENAEERKIWRNKVLEGWEEGYAQADDIFAADLARLTRDFEGMVRYKMLLSQKMVSAPYALHEDRGITGGGDTMRIGDRAVQITGKSQLQARPDSWQPASR